MSTFRAKSFAAKGLPLPPAVFVAEALERRTFLSAAPGAVPWGGRVEVDGSIPGGVILRDVNPVNLSVGDLSAPVADESASPAVGAKASAGGGLQIVLKEGPRLRANAAAAAAFRTAADFIQSQFSDPITVVVDAEIDTLGAGVLGQTGSSEFHFQKDSDYDSVRDLMVKDAGGGEGIVGQLPTLSQFNVTLPRVGSGGAFKFAGLTATRANLLALGMAPSDLTRAPFSDYDPTVKRDMEMTFNSNYTFDYDRTDGITPGRVDFTGVVIHELTHGLGFLSEVDSVDYLRDVPGIDRSLYPTTLDLYRLRPGAGAASFTAAPRVLTTGDEVSDQVVYDGGVYNPTGFNIPGLTRGDVPMSTGETFGDGQQASHWKDDEETGIYIGAMDPTAPPGRQITYTANDTRALGLIGWDLVGASQTDPEPQPEPTPTPQLATLSGTAFADDNRNGKRDTGEATRSGITVWIDVNDDGSLDPGDQTTRTDGGGAYQFTNLVPGTYHVRANPPTGTALTSPASGVYDVTVAEGDARTGLDFGSAAASVVATPAPVGWSAADVGNNGVRGGSSQNGTTFSVQASGAGVAGTADGCQFVYQTLSGDGQIIARVTEVGNTDPLARAGVMIRQSLDAGSKNAFIGLTPASGLRYSTRAAADGTTDSLQAPQAQWVRLSRVGSTFTAYESADGITWQLVGAQTIDMTGITLIGLAVTSGNNAALNTSTFDSVALSGVDATTGGSQPVTLPPIFQPPDVPGGDTAERRGTRAGGKVPWA